MPVEGLQEVIDKLQRLTDDRLARTIQRRALKDVAEMVLNQMKHVTPVSSVRNIHGIDAENILSFTRKGSAGYKIGLSNMNGDWERTRGLWFQNFKTDEPNYCWYTKFYNEHKEEWLEQCREHIKIAVNEFLRTY